ncbi:S8 family serine peptidase [Mycolicibacter heraklionensis]|uniref:S53 family peptidase n=1 Tax=Mycolicibacter heraklionensis TaxID=512402 RepID=UPI0009E4C779|nr:S53 family peptidase [Mycolicibacter heraklionensis]
MELTRHTVVQPRAHQSALSPLQVAKVYHFPTMATGKGYTAGIIELGGGYRPSQIAQYFQDQGLQAPSFVDVRIGDGANRPDGPNGADGEVQLDLEVAGSIAPGAFYRVYFADNTDAGFLDALKQAVLECDGVSISWGASENQWDGSTMDAFEAVIKAARANGVPVFVAAGDSGSTDSSGVGNQVDFPASAPSAIGCGGTRLTIDNAGERASETAWNDSSRTSATGGGVSQHFPGRTVPDIAGNADPDTGYEVDVDGQPYVVGGTSAVAPLMLGLHALLWEICGGATFDLSNLIATNPQAMFDVTAGDNGGFKAGPGRDDVTGWGVPDGAKLLAALESGIPAPVPPTPPVDPPTVPPTQPPASAQPISGTFTITGTGTFTPNGNAA